MRLRKRSWGIYALLIDWGSAQPIGALRRRRMRTLTPEFTSLEQLQGRALAANDMYALGKTLEMLVARPSNWLQAIMQRATARTNRRYPHVLALYYALARLCIIDDIAGCFGIMMVQAYPAAQEGEGC